MGKITVCLALSGCLSLAMAVGCSSNKVTAPSKATATPTFTAQPQGTVTCSIPSQAGNTVVGATQLAGAGLLMANKITLPGYGGIQSISVYLQSASGVVEVSVYTDNGGAPQSLLFTPQAAVAANGWNTILVPATYLNAGNYWIAFEVQNSTNAVYSTGGSLAYVSSSWGTFPATYPTTGLSTASSSFSAYLNYCGLGAPTSTPTITFTPTITPTPTVTFTSTATSTSTPTSTNTPTPGINVIDTMEQDGSGGYQIIVQQGRNGYWYDETDSLGTGSNISPVTTGNFVMSSPGYQSNYCARITGTTGANSGGNTAFAAMLATFLSPSAGYSIPTSYTGIAFMMKASFSGICFNPPIVVKIADATTDNPSEDNNCERVTVPSGVWTPVTVFFDQMLTSGYAEPVTHALDTTTAYKIAWQFVYPNTTYDISVDNVEFITATAPATVAPLSGSTAWPVSLIDNCERDWNQILPNEGRGGYWFIFDNSTVDTVCPSTSSNFEENSISSNPDGESSQTPYAAAITGTMGTGGYPGIGFNFLTQSGGYDQTYDIQTSTGGPYTGLQFWALSGTDPVSVAVGMGDATTDPNISGATCTTACNHSHQAVISISGGWTLYQVPFTSMVGSATYGDGGTTVDPTTATQATWVVQTPGAYNLMVDDISFY